MTPVDLDRYLNPIEPLFNFFPGSLHTCSFLRFCNKNAGACMVFCFPDSLRSKAIIMWRRAIIISGCKSQERRENLESRKNPLSVPNQPQPPFGFAICRHKLIMPIKSWIQPLAPSIGETGWGKQEEESFSFPHRQWSKPLGSAKMDWKSHKNRLPHEIFYCFLFLVRQEIPSKQFLALLQNFHFQYRPESREWRPGWEKDQRRKLMRPYEPLRNVFFWALG